MAFEVQTKTAALIRSENRCECSSPLCGDHVGRCIKELDAGRFEVLRRDLAGAETIHNAEAVCPDCFSHRRGL
jgi:hypothetical protein